ncbi:MAG: WYL domain-containing protein [Eubacteriales bacterium]|nr:WYL domain-containing protein [Eubacteriales bacterium]
MYILGDRQMLDLMILEILREYSDENHRLTQQQIIRYLKANYDVECDRRTVKSYVEKLQNMETDLGIKVHIDDGRRGYYIDSFFNDAELRMLIDSVLCSKNLTAEQSGKIIAKLKNLGNKYFSPMVSHVHNLSRMHKGKSSELIEVVSCLNDAISRGRKVSFNYNSYDVGFELKPRRREKYIVNPYQMAVANGFYYLIGNLDKYDDISHYRIDKITNIRVLEDEPVKPMNLVKGLEHGLNLPKHMAEHIYMYSGGTVNAQIDVPLDMMNELVDWFGTDFQIMSKKKERMVIRVTCNRQALIYWSLQYGPFAEVLSPDSLRDEIKAEIEKMHEKYQR